MHRLHRRARNLLGIETGRDIANLTPSVSLQGEYLTVRGGGRYLDPGRGLDPGIAVHVDGVYTSSPAYLNQPDFLTDRIEVLRGAQSVFGRNSIGGTVNVFSKRPTADLHGDLRAGYTSEETAYADAAVSGPITDKLRFRADYAWSNTQDGAQNNIAPGRANPGTGSTRLYELQLEADPTPDTRLHQSEGRNCPAGAAEQGDLPAAVRDAPAHRRPQLLQHHHLNGFTLLWCVQHTTLLRS